MFCVAKVNTALTSSSSVSEMELCRAVILTAVFAAGTFSKINVIVRRDVSSKESETLSVSTFQDLRDFKVVTVFNTSTPVLADLGDLPKLEELSFALAQVQRLEPHCFHDVPNLRTVLLTSNPIEEIAGQVFANLPIRDLILSNNSIARVHSSAFDDMSSLERVDLSLNRIEQVDPKWFANSPNVRALILRENSIGEVPDRAFANVVGVRTIDLAGNKIAVVRPEAFHGLGALTKLNLSKNRISEIPGSAFRDVRSLVLVAIGNELKCLPETVLETVKSATLLLNRIDEECKQKIKQFKKAHPLVHVFY